MNRRITFLLLSLITVTALQAADITYNSDKTVATVTGEIAKTDLTTISGLTQSVIDLTGATFADGVSVADIESPTVEYLALPMDMTKEQVQAESFEKRPKLKGAASLTATGSDTYSITAYIEQPGSMYSLINKTSLVSKLGGNQWYYQTSKLNGVTISGNINSCDIGISLVNANVTSDGHLTTDNPTYNTPSNFAFNNANSILSLDLEKANFGKDHNADMTLSKLGYGEALKSLILPTSADMTTIPDDACNNLKNITSICIPSNYTSVGKDAFYNCISLSHIYTTRAAGDDFVDSNYYHGDNTYTLPSSLKSIATGAFNTGKKTISDLYILAKTAPECGKDAFTSGMYDGWGGFKENGNFHHPYSRANYINNGILFTVLHFPSDVDDENLKRYTDPTRVYTLRDETGATDGEGNPKMWPKHEEFVKSYNQAVQGVIWDGTTAYDTKYTGWHQFCLAESKNLKENGKIVDFSRFKKNDWYSYCVPYDIRRSDLLQYLGNPEEGKYPDVTTLVQVKRDGDKQKVTLIFSQSLIEQDVTLDENGRVQENADGTVAYTQYTDDDPIVIHAGRPYLIHPWYESGKSPKFESAEKYTVAINAGTEGTAATLDASFTHASETANKMRLHDNWDVMSKTVGNATAMEYRFQGIYNSGHTIPDYCYFLAESAKKHINKFWWSGQDTYKDMVWSPYSALIIARPAKSKWVDQTTEKDVLNYTLTVTGEDDSFTTSAGAKHGGITFDFSEMSNTTGISTVIDGQEVDVTYGRVYNLNGQYVGTSLNGLQKGIYVVNGKKVVVK